MILTNNQSKYFLNFQDTKCISFGCTALDATKFSKAVSSKGAMEATAEALQAKDLAASLSKIEIKSECQNGKNNDRGITYFPANALLAQISLHCPQPNLDNAMFPKKMLICLPTD